MTRTRSSSQPLFSFAAMLVVALLIAVSVASRLGAQMSSPVLLVLEKADSTMAIVDPATLKIVARVPAGPDPHEVAASPPPPPLPNGDAEPPPPPPAQKPEVPAELVKTLPEESESLKLPDPAGVAHALPPPPPPP